MITKEALRAKAHEIGFADIGFTTAEPFESQQEVLESRAESYGFLIKIMDLMEQLRVMFITSRTEINSLFSLLTGKNIRQPAH